MALERAEVSRMIADAIKEERERIVERIAAMSVPTRLGTVINSQGGLNEFPDPQFTMFKMILIAAIDKE